MKKDLTTAIMACASLLAATAGANVITFDTPSGATTGGGAVDASATFTTGAGTLTITLTDLQADPKDVAQLISDLDFVLSSGQTSGTLGPTSSSGQQITVNSGGTFTLGTTGSTGWGLNNNVSGGLQLDALGYVGPAGLIIGPPNGSSLYANANNSIAGNGPHNPFINQSATFTVTIPGLTANDTVTGATFSFGTTAGIDVTGIPNVPDGGMTVLLLGTALSGLGLIRRKLS